MLWGLAKEGREEADMTMTKIAKKSYIALEIFF